MLIAHDANYDCGFLLKYLASQKQLSNWVRFYQYHTHVIETVTE